MLEFGTARIFWASSKNISIFLPYGKPKFTAKRVLRRHILKHLHHKDYLRTSKGTDLITATFITLLSQKQQIKTIEFTNKCLSAFDDKRYILNDGITTIAYGHYKIAQFKSTKYRMGIALTFIFCIFQSCSDIRD